jgi:hypothetical protein
MLLALNLYLGLTLGFYPPPAPPRHLSAAQGRLMPLAFATYSKAPDGCKGDWTNRAASLPRKG